MRMFRLHDCQPVTAATSNDNKKKSRFLKFFGLSMALIVCLSFQAKADYTIPAGTTKNASELKGLTGVLTINGTLNIEKNKSANLSFTSVIINGPGGKITWEQNDDLSFPAGTSFKINNPGPGVGLIGSNNGSQRLVIGNTIIAVSSTTSNNALVSFEDFNQLGFSFPEDMTTCTGNIAPLEIKPRKLINGLTFNYQWSIQPGATFSPNNTSGNVQLNSLTPGTYNVTCVATTIKGNQIVMKTTFNVSIVVIEKNNWLGVNSDWHDPKNWPCGEVPNSASNVTIGLTNNDPIISKQIAFSNNLNIVNGASLKTENTLQISGNISNAGVFDATAGALEFKGGNIQTISGSMFKGKTIGNLIVSNTAGLMVNETPGDTLNITGNLTFGTASASLNSGDNITMKSTIHGTANIGIVQPGNVIKGKFIVEKYINTGTNKSLDQHGKAWMLLSTPTKGSTIFESWQEGGKSTGKAPIANNLNGFGTLLTTGYNNVPANGFDLYTGPGPSIKTYVSTTNSYDKGPISTNEPIYNEKGYLVMVRGDRSVFTYNGAPVPVVLRTKGEILTGTTEEIKVAAGKWESIGNPYASRIYINNIQRTGGVDEFITVWDPKLGGSYGLGAFQTLVNMGSGYMAIPGGGSYGKEAVSYIESGQAFFVQATKEDGSVYFTEDAKVPSIKNRMGRGAGTGSKVSFLRSNLYALGTGDAVLSDGNILLTGNYSNDIDGMDGRKMDNSAENFSILSSGQKLSVESRRDIISNDTIFFNMASMRAQKYRLEMVAESLGTPGMFGWLEDKFAGTKTFLNLNGTTEYVFTVSNEKGSAAADRFMIVFRPAAVLPVTFTEVKASKNNDDILVEWTVEAESNLKQYEVEKSVDGNTFSKAATVAASKANGGKYQWLDQAPASGYNYYRIRSVDMDGKTSLTQIVKVKIETAIGNISVYPNPITNGTVNVQLGNQPEGVYNLRLLNPVGQVLLTTKINHAGGSHTEKINWDHSLPRGMYTLEVSNIQTGVKMIKLLY